MRNFDEFFDGYAYAILECETECAVIVDELHPDDAKNLRRDAAKFFYPIRKFFRLADRTRGYTFDQAGFDLYLTAAGHGAGYWDRDVLPRQARDILTARAGRGEYQAWTEYGQPRIEFYRK